MRARGVTRARLIATEACRSARNGVEFLREVRDRLGLHLEIVDRETEAYLAAAGCGELVDADAESTLLFDIGGGSSEICWMARSAEGAQSVAAWESLRLGVVSLAETFGGDDVTPKIFSAMVEHVDAALAPFAERVKDKRRCARFHLLGTSGTVTTLAGVHLDLPRYDTQNGRRTAASARSAPISCSPAAPSWRRFAVVFPPSASASPTGACAKASCRR
jgi:exopolyphosphatase/guanosine-5'-triphosphate,3'-diphosphate pyrophosphatase